MPLCSLHPSFATQGGESNPHLSIPCQLCEHAEGTVLGAIVRKLAATWDWLHSIERLQRLTTTKSLVDAHLVIHRRYVNLLHDFYTSVDPTVRSSFWDEYDPLETPTYTPVSSESSSSDDDDND